MSEKKKSPKRAKRRISWVRTLLRFLLVPVLCIVAVMVGLFIGYVVIGGRDSSEIWLIETWKHVYDLVFAE